MVLGSQFYGSSTRQGWNEEQKIWKKSHMHLTIPDYSYSSQIVTLDQVSKFLVILQKHTSEEKRHRFCQPSIRKRYWFDLIIPYLHTTYKVNNNLWLKLWIKFIRRPWWHMKHCKAYTHRLSISSVEWNYLQHNIWNFLI